jgi:hypothetical protein
MSTNALVLGGTSPRLADEDPRNLRVIWLFVSERGVPL